MVVAIQILRPLQGLREILMEVLRMVEGGANMAKLEVIEGLI
jgi:hypothetical protein